jgi:hypothetical protein
MLPITIGSIFVRAEKSQPAPVSTSLGSDRGRTAESMKSKYPLP